MQTSVSMYECRVNKHLLYGFVASWDLLPNPYNSNRHQTLIFDIPCSSKVWLGIYVIVIPRYEYDIVVITRVRGEAEYEC